MLCCGLLQYLAVCCNVLQSANRLVLLGLYVQHRGRYVVLHCVAVSCSVWQCAVVPCSVLQCAAACCGVLRCVTMHMFGGLHA